MMSNRKETDRKYWKNGKIKSQKNLVLKYSHAERNFETYARRSKEITLKLKTNEIKNIELILSKHNSKTNNFEHFSDYIKEKYKYDKILFDFYSRDIFRKLKFRRFSRKQKHENKFLNDISKKFKTKDKKLLICIGDWSNKNSIKHSPSTMGIGLKKMISKKYETYLLDEYHTSMKCSKCHRDIKLIKGKFRLEYCDCVNVRNNRITNKQYINRDMNSCLNMLYIVDYMIKNNMKRPVEYSKKSEEIGEPKKIKKVKEPEKVKESKKIKKVKGPKKVKNSIAIFTIPSNI